MFCPNCGENLPDDSKFCGSCGANLEEFASVTETEEKDNPPVATQTESESVQPKPESVQLKPESVQPKPVQIKKSYDKKIIAGIAAAAVVLVVVAVLGIKVILSFSGGKGNTYAYFSDGNYELITNVKQVKSIEIASSRAERAYNDLLTFSPDGKYVYYYTKYDTSTATGTLCRAEYGKLKEDTSNNSKYTEVIASNVSVGLEFLDDGTVIYTNGDGSLFYYDGKENSRIAKNVNYFYTDGSKRVAYVTGDYDTEYTLYGVYLDDIDNEIKLASHLNYICTAKDFDNILYVKLEDDYSQTLYVVGFEKDSQRLGRGVNIVSTLDEQVYFTLDNGNALNLYDYVEDDNSLTDYSYVELREMLDDEENAYPVKTLYCYADGKLTEIHDSVLDCLTYDGAIMFNTVDLVTEKARMRDIKFVDNVTSLFLIDFEAKNYVVLTNGTDVCQMSDSAAEEFGELFDEGYGYLFGSDGNDIYLGDTSGNVSIAHISDGEIGKFQHITDDGEILDIDGSKLYYVSNTYKRDSWTYGDLYAYNNGKKTNLAKDVMLDVLQTYEDDVVMAYTDYRSNYGYELTMFDSKGKANFIGEDVTQFIRVDPSTVLYISDDDLYCYNGKENVKIKRDVEWVWSNNFMEVSNYLSYFDVAIERLKQ